jgi:N-acetylglucosamine malate deacetylase 2
VTDETDPAVAAQRDQLRPLGRRTLGHAHDVLNPTGATMDSATEPRTATTPSQVPSYGHLAVVCAHPDDETFGLGALITAFVAAGTRVDLVCLTCGESSTLGAAADLADRRSRELACAAQVLGVETVTIHHHPDGALSSVPLATLVTDILAVASDAGALLTFDHGGITGHPDHQHATDAAVMAGARLGVPVLGWAIPEPVAATLRQEHGAPFVGRSATDIDLEVTVDRTRQLDAMTCHGSQLADNPVPQRRIALQGDREHLRALHHPGPSRPTGS